MNVRRQQLAKALNKAQSAKPVILRNTPPGYNWGWYSREDSRMHLQILNAKNQQESEYKVWLENQGHRTCEAAGKIPRKILKAIQADVNKYRRYIEDRWVSFVIRQGWLESHFSVPQVTLVIYPNTPNTFSRVIDLIEDITSQEIQALRSEDISLSPEMASLQIWPTRPEDQRQDIRLSTVIWQG